MLDMKKDYGSNMPETAERYVKAFLLDDTYSWWGLVQCLSRNLSFGDLEELADILNTEVEEERSRREYL